MNIKTSILSVLCGMALAPAWGQNLPDDAVYPDWQSEIPRVVYPDRDLVQLYEKT